MDMFGFKFTRLQSEIFRLLCINAGKSLNQREIAKKLNVSPTAVSKSLIYLTDRDLILIKKNGIMNLNLIELNRDNKKVIELKRVENLKMIYESGVINFLDEEFPGSVIILFGSYSYGEDIIDSDIDIAIVGCCSKNVNLDKFEDFFKKDININFYKDFKEINKNLKNNLFNGIVLSGRIGL